MSVVEVVADQVQVQVDKDLAEVKVLDYLDKVVEEDTVLEILEMIEEEVVKEVKVAEMEMDNLEKVVVVEKVQAKEEGEILAEVEENMVGKVDMVVLEEVK